MKRVDIQKLRESTGFSLNRLAREVGVGRRTIMRWLNGDVEPSPLAREQLKRFQIHVSAAGTDQMSPPSLTPRRHTYESLLDHATSPEPPRLRGVVPSGRRRTQD